MSLGEFLRRYLATIILAIVSAIIGLIIGNINTSLISIVILIVGFPVQWWQYSHNDLYNLSSTIGRIREDFADITSGTK